MLIVFHCMQRMDRNWRWKAKLIYNTEAILNR